MSVKLEDSLAPLEEHLSKGSVDVEWFARELVERKLISQSSSDSALGKYGTADSAKAHSLIKEVITQIQADESKLKELQTILENEKLLQLLKIHFSTPESSMEKREATKVEISCQQIGDEEAIKLCEAMSKQVLDLDIYLDLSWSKKREVIRRNRKLALQENGISKTGATELSKALTHCPRLRKLDLCRNHIGKVGSIELSKTLLQCTSLQYLDLSWNHLYDEGITALADGLQNCTLLVTLNLHTNLMTEKGAIELSKALKHCKSLQTLDVSRNEFGAEGGVALSGALQNCKQLKTLNFASGSINDKGAVELSETVMQHCRELQTMNLSWNSIGDKGACSLGVALKQSEKLLSLDLCSNKFREEGFTALTEGLKHCLDLKSLDISRNGTCMNQKTVGLLGDMLTHCKRLQELDLSFNSIYKEGAKILSKGLKSCVRLHTLDLHKNEIGDEGSIALCEVLKHSKQLKSLVLSKNEIHEEGAKALSEGLKSCSVLKTLDLSWNTIGEGGAEALSEALENCPNLQKLDLHKNNISDKGTHALCKALKHSTELQSLILSDNDIKGAVDSRSTMHDLSEALKLCTELQTLDLSKNNIPNKEATTLTKAKKEYWPHLQNLDIGYETESQPSTSDRMEQFTEVEKRQDDKLITSVGGVDKTTVDSQQSITSSYLRGVNVIAQTSITIRVGEALSFQWKGYGLKLHMPEGALPPHLSECTLHIQASLSGQFEFPDSSELVSAVYWISCGTKFSEPLTLELQHCAVGQTSSLQFVRAQCTQKTLPYQFKPINGVFTRDSDYGSTSITHFSGIGIVKRALSYLLGRTESYLAQIYIKNIMYKKRVYVVVTKNLDIILSDVEKRLKGAEKEESLTIEFEDKKMLVEASSEDGWKIVELYHPIIKQEEVQHFRGNADPPKCVLDVTWTGGEGEDTNSHYVKFDFKGAKPPKNYCRVDFSQDKSSSAKGTTTNKTPYRGLKHVLSVSDLPRLSHDLESAAQNWRKIGQALNFTHSNLNIISRTAGLHDDEAFFQEMLSRWFKHNTPENTTVEILAEALKKAEEDRLAQFLKQQYTSG